MKEQIPFVKTVLGISNISFGLPASAREVVNSVFLYYCTKAGLDLAIVNAEKLERFASIPEDERRLAESLLFNTPPAEVADEHPQHDLLLNAPQDWREQSKAERAAAGSPNEIFDMPSTVLTNGTFSFTSRMPSMVSTAAPM